MADDKMVEMLLQALVDSMNALKTICKTHAELLDSHAKLLAEHEALKKGDENG